MSSQAQITFVLPNFRIDFDEIEIQDTSYVGTRRLTSTLIALKHYPLFKQPHPSAPPPDASNNIS
jgi:hypothetical protein